jgi:hypothetical protein
MGLHGMKFLLKKNLRRFFVTLLSILLAASLLFLVKTIVKPDLIEEKVPQYAYSQQAQVNYRVYLAPNSLYQEKSLEAGKVYITNFVDSINTFFTYKYNGDRVAEIKGEYSVAALLEATVGRDKDDTKKIWQREFLLLPSTGFTGRDRMISAQQEVPIKLPDFDEFVKNVNKESGITPDDVKMTVRWNITLEADTDSGPIKEQLMPTLVIPLAKKAFEIGGELKIDKPGVVNTTRQVSVINKKALVSYAMATGLCSIGLVFMLLFTTGAAGETDPLQKRIKQIFKKHGDRLAVIDGEIPAVFENIIPVRSMEDLVRIADELSKPIMYKPFNGEGKIPSFYIFDEPKIFVFALNDLCFNATNSEGVDSTQSC